MGIRPRQQPIPTSQIAQDVLHQTETIHQDVRKNAKQVYIKFKVYYDKKAKTSQLKETYYVYVLQPKADHQVSKAPFTELNTKPTATKRPTLQNLKKQEADFVYILQPKADHQGSKIAFTEFRWMGPYIVEKVLPNNNYLVRKIGTNKTQVLHRMRLRQFKSRQPPTDVRVKPQEYKPDPEVSLNHDDLYARAWEYHYEQPISDAENKNATPPNSHEIPV